jgi:hypothetical protein
MSLTIPNSTKIRWETFCSNLFGVKPYIDPTSNTHTTWWSCVPQSSSQSIMYCYRTWCLTYQRLDEVCPSCNNYLQKTVCVLCVNTGSCSKTETELADNAEMACRSVGFTGKYHQLGTICCIRPLTIPDDSCRDRLKIKYSGGWTYDIGILSLV